MSRTFDIVICGAGIAGLTLGRQIRRSLPHLSVLLIDQHERPLPLAAFKVGESMTEIAAQYFTETLGLGDYMEERHLRKLGLRFFFQDPDGGRVFHRRPEAGVSRYTPPYAYQIDRGRIEQDLREMLDQQGATLMEGTKVAKIMLSSNGAPHRVATGNSDGSQGEVRCRWVVDALGRHSIIRRQLGLTRKIEGGDAAWARVAQRVDVDDFVDADHPEWHRRVPGRTRYYSTNHLVGDGYWVWLIPLAGGFTSVGIVTHPHFHDYREYNTQPKFRRWLEIHEPLLAERLSMVEFMDFRKMPRYSFSSSQVFSARRWACTGEASAFPDPLYSPNFELIALNNSIISHLIARDLEQSLHETEVAEYNRFFIVYSEGLGEMIRSMYYCFGSSVPGALKVLWDTLTSWSFNAPLHRHGLFLDNARRTRSRGETGRFLFLTRRVQRMFRNWASQSQGNLRVDFLDYLALPWYPQIRRCGLTTDSASDFARIQSESLAFFEELAQVLFLMALADTHPSLLDRMPKPFWINAWSIGLDPAKWDADKLFEPRSEPRTLLPILDPLSAQFIIQGMDRVDIR